MKEISPAILAAIDAPPKAAAGHPWVMAHFGAGDAPSVMYLRYRLAEGEIDPEVSLTVIERRGDEPKTFNLSSLFSLAQAEGWWECFPTTEEG